jgi:carboxylesterase type B
MRIRTGICLVGAALAGVLAIPGSAVAAAAGGHHGNPLVVVTDKGAVRGFRAQGVDSFLGIRYAAPPTGALRWRPPQPAQPWSGVVPATAYGNRCAAAASTNGPRTEAEDCLFVNVQRPSGLTAGGRRPVYVFIHGGGLVNGSSNQADMAAMVQATGVVGVTFNYRLGVLGFLGLPQLTAEGGESGNYGFMDQQAALRWIQRNIGAFGGDPRRVTVGGESAGGWSVCGHLVAPGSRGLLSQAMMQSGSCDTRTQREAETAGTATADAVGCTDPATVVACLRATPVGRLIDAPNQSFRLVRGTPTLPLDPAVAVSSGQFARVPVVIGANRDEGRTFAQGDIGWSQDQYVAWVRDTFDANADAVLARYPWPANADRFTPAYLVGAVMTDSGILASIGGCANRRLTRDLARWTRTYAYEFAHRTGPGLTPIPGYIWGAGHAAELAYLFPSFDNGTPIAPTFNAAERRLARDMKHYWGAFTLHGTPNGPGLARWPGYNGTGTVMSLRAGGQSRPISDAQLVAEHQCGFWDSLA